MRSSDLKNQLSYLMGSLKTCTEDAKLLKPELEKEKLLVDVAQLQIGLIYKVIENLETLLGQIDESNESLEELIHD